MTDKLKTYVISSPDQTLTNFSLDLAELAGYAGFIYFMMGSGGPGTPNYGGSSGYASSGYIDLTYPYNINQVSVTLNPSGQTTLSLNPTTGPGPNTAIIIKSDTGSIFSYTTPSSYSPTYTGFYHGANISTDSSFYNQRGFGAAGMISEGPMTSDFGVTIPPVYGGGGFYGGGNDIPYGYSSGASSVSSNQTIGYAILTFIPNSIIDSTIFGPTDITGSVGATGSFTPGMYLYSGLAGGGGGGGGYIDGVFGENFYGGGGGGSGEHKFGFYVTGSTGTYIAGQGGSGGGSATSGNSGTPTSITVAELGIPPILLTAGSGGYGAGGVNGSGGVGWYGGGRGVGGAAGSANDYDGYSTVNMQAYMPTGGDNNDFSSTGGGAVSGFGQGHDGSGATYTNAGGGGGGWFGGNGGWNLDSGEAEATSAFSYGGGGGGASTYSGGTHTGGNGAYGYVLLKKIINTPNVNLRTILKNSLAQPYTLNFYDFNQYKGVWILMAANTSNICHNTFHFSIKEDNVRSIKVSQDINGFIDILLTFSVLNSKVQTFTMKSTSNSESYMNLLFYS